MTIKDEFYVTALRKLNIVFVVVSQKSWMGIILMLQKATEAKIKKFCRKKLEVIS